MTPAKDIIYQSRIMGYKNSNGKQR